MPTYVFRCRECGDHERVYPMAAVPDESACDCGRLARRRPTGAVLGAGGSAAMRALDASAAMRALDASAASASAPQVVTALPGRARRSQPVTTNPRHARLPRP